MSEILKSTILPILNWPDDQLHQVSADVTEFIPELEQLGTNLLMTMKTRNGVGLAAPQCGVLLNVIAIWIEEKQPMVLVNPKITYASDDLMKFEEGCLSVPGYFEDRERPRTIQVVFQDVKGEKHDVEFNNLYAFCIQHELDHLAGKLFIDGSSELKKDRIRARMRKVAKKKGNRH
jgi:peptide deformylase